MLMKNLLEQIKKIKVLYVEDDANTRAELEYILKSKVFELYVAEDGEEGFRLYKKNIPDLVITDIQMPKLNGIQMSKLIKDYNPDAKIVIISAFNESNYLLEAIKLNINSYIQKPLDIKQLFHEMGKLAKNINLEKEKDELYNTLNQYRNIVDERSIVSKTDRNGVITYVNKPFEKISGYSSEELIGNTHSLIKHEDTNVEVYEDMWDTLISKDMWTGIIKNKKKNGDGYIVDTLIKPILDVNGDIEEYIALTYDITDLERSKEYFKNQTLKATSNLKESIRVSKLYKDAINQSNMILRVNKDRKILYVNDAFCEISGYSQKELIGKDYSIVRDKRVEVEEYEKKIDELQAYLDKGNIWKGKISNTKKDGTLFHCNLTIYPLEIEKGEISEYLGIRHDITEIENLHKELEKTQREVVYKLGEIGETRSKETGNHVKRVAEYSKLLAIKYGLDEKETNTLFTASPMHDIGKVGIPDSILNKPGKLDNEEWEVMRTHSEIGYNILKSSNREILKAAAIVSYTHHEKWNGSGYPLGLSGEDIHIFGRITAIADVFDALGSHRVYKEAWPLEKILEFFESEKGKHFEPKLIEIFMDNLEEFLKIRDMYQD